MWSKDYIRLLMDVRQSLHCSWSNVIDSGNNFQVSTLFRTINGEYNILQRYARPYAHATTKEFLYL